MSKSTPKQDAIEKFMATGIDFTLDEILAGVPQARTYGPVDNQKSHLFRCLQRMIKRGVVKRVQRGVYALTCAPVIELVTFDGDSVVGSSVIGPLTK
jgi:predicted transcriptional regulator of viral defense system